MNETRVLPESPPLAQYRPLNDYSPTYGDFVVWSGWLTTWVGVVSRYDPRTDELDIIFSTVPFLLFTLTENEQKKETRKKKLSEIKTATRGSFAVLNHDFKTNSSIWYI